MRHVFTTREKVLLVILAVLVIAVGYWKLILTPINDSIADLNAQTASEQDAILTNSARLSRMRQMQQELEDYLDLSASEYGVTYGGAKGNITLTSFDGSMKV